MSLFDEIPAQHRAAFLAFMAEQARPVQVQDRESYPWSDWPWGSYNEYGWQDYSISEHFRPGECAGLVIPESGVEFRDTSYSMFQDTFSPNSNVLGLNAYGGDENSPSQIHCQCEKYKGLMIRYEGGLEKALLAILRNTPATA